MILSHSSVVSCYSMEHKLSDFVFGTHIAILCYLFYLLLCPFVIPRPILLGMMYYELLTHVSSSGPGCAGTIT